MRPAVASLLLLVLAAPLAAPAVAADAKVAAGEDVFNTYCSNCHGTNLESSGQSFDLRKLQADERARFERSVLNGKNQMPPWKGVLSDEEIDQLWAYIRAHANDR